VQVPGALEKMRTTLKTTVANYLRSGDPAQRTREEHSTTFRKWERWAVEFRLTNLDASFDGECPSCRRRFTDAQGQ
jgi:hypothetical protein